MTQRPELAKEFKAFMQNNPGLQNSVAGTKYLIDVLRQATTQDIQLGQLASRVQDPRSWPAVEDRFYQQNPIKSPFTGQPLSGDERVAGAPQPSATNKTAPAPGKYRWDSLTAACSRKVADGHRGAGAERLQRDVPRGHQC